MGNTGSSDSIGKKISDGFNVMGKKMGEGWEQTKAFGKKAYDAIKSVPVLGDIAQGIEKYTPIGLLATNVLKGIDAAATGGSKLLQGDVKGAIGTATSYGRDFINQSNPLLEIAKKVPGLGTIASGIDSLRSGAMKSIGNAALNAVDSFTAGDVKGGLQNIAKGGAGYLSTRSGTVGLVGKALGKIV